MARTVRTDLIIVVPAILLTTWMGASLRDKLIASGTQAEGHPCVCNVRSTRLRSLTRARPSCGLINPIRALQLPLSLFSESSRSNGSKGRAERLPLLHHFSRLRPSPFRGHPI